MKKKNTRLDVGDLFYIWGDDPKCETIFETQKITKTGNAKLYHPVVGAVIVPLASVKASIY